MARLTLFVSLGLALSSIPSGLAGPACARKHYQVADCVSICKSKWGWTGSMMGTDPWGSVVKKVDTDKWNAVVSEACGTPVASSMASTAAEPARSTSTALQTESVIPTVAVTTTSATSSATQSTTSAISSKVSSSSSSSSQVPSSSISAQGFLASARRSSTTVPPQPTTTSTTPQRQSTSTKVETVFTTPRPATTKAPQPTRTPVSGGNSGSTSNADIQAYLAGHNTIRAQHGASSLTWSNNLAAKAQQWANNCKFQHSGGSLGPFGENLAAGTGSGYGISQAIKDWTDEVSEYNPSNPVASHFTQVVWKGTSQVGCAVQSCNGIFDASFGPAKYFVCEYSAQGNIVGQFAQNVQV